MLTWVIWIGAAVWATWKMEEQLFKSTLVGLLIVIVVGLACFLLYPTYIQRPLLTGDDWATRLLRFVYHNDHVYNAFPSGHVYITTLIALFWARWYPRLRWLWLTVVVVIGLSTLFTHQHYLPDPFAGLALGLAGYHFGRRIVREWSPGPYQPALEQMPH
jgi:membrane-associated phospholipid phosphatase